MKAECLIATVYEIGIWEVIEAPSFRMCLTLVREAKSVSFLIPDYFVKGFFGERKEI